MNLLSKIEARLRELDTADQVTRELADLNPLSVLADEVELLARADESEAAGWLCSPLGQYDAVSWLLRAAAKAVGGHPSLRSLLLRTLRYVLDFPREHQSDFDELAVEAVKDILPTLSPELRSVAFFCVPSFLRSGAWEEGTDYAVLRHQPGTIRLPEEEVAPLESIEGRRQRLELLGYLSNDPPDAWQLGSRAALVFFQIDHDLEATGKVDEGTADLIDALAWAALYSADRVAR